jgi:hypothetical protein
LICRFICLKGGCAAARRFWADLSLIVVEVSNALTQIVNLMMATATAFMSDAGSAGGKAPTARSKGATVDAGSPKSVASKQLLRVWVHGDDIYPDVVQVNHGTVLIQAENQVSADITLVVEQIVEGLAPQQITTISAAQHASCAKQTLTLSPGQYVFYEQSRPGVIGKMVVE